MTLQIESVFNDCLIWCIFKLYYTVFSMFFCVFLSVFVYDFQNHGVCYFVCFNILYQWLFAGYYCHFLSHMWIFQINFMEVFWCLIIYLLNAWIYFWLPAPVWHVKLHIDQRSTWCIIFFYLVAVLCIFAHSQNHGFCWETSAKQFQINAAKFQQLYFLKLDWYILDFSLPYNVFVFD